MAEQVGVLRPSCALAEHRDEVVRLLNARGVTNPRVFGSVARGEDHPGSDLDLLVTVDPDQAWEFVSVSRELSELLGVPVDVVSDRGLKPKHAEVRTEAIPL
ncbi:MAG: nucleotidyltransferase family protein [Galactobacter sp.]